MSKNSPHFVKKLIANVGNESDYVKRSVALFLNYHPINEFEPFFESIGLEPSEFSAFLPRNLMFLSDEVGLLDKYHVLCKYGIARVQMGKIYREAREVFRYDKGVLQSKLLGFEQVGMRKDFISRAVRFNLCILINGINEEFLELVSRLKCLGFENSLFEQKFFETTSYNWRQINHLLQLLLQYLGCRRCPGILFDHSGRRRPALLLIGFLLKFGCSRSDICSILLRFPQIKVEKFVWNLRRAFELLFEIEMDAVNIGRIIREHFTWIGTCRVMKASYLLCHLRSGKIHLRQIIVANPLELKKWTLGAKIERVPETKEIRLQRDRNLRIKFLTSIGFVENSKEIENVLKICRGKGEELPERFDLFVKAGISESDVTKMIRRAPQILNQSAEALEAKINVIVNELGYPVSKISSYPKVLQYTMDRVKVRCAMHRWLLEQFVVRSTLSLYSIIGSTKSCFVNTFVNRHPLGPQVWQEYKLKKANSGQY
ncbi:transcription termination factor MTEF18, mitochondrial-like [Silene latifolia]|uniref:transcription termination factor MTEF18, mitochondrial-like n=1 Tax=Silene latifolia TaxID=37657 RepID=UPI003D76D6C4